MSLITRYVDQDDLGNGTLRNTINLRPVGYRRAGALLRSVHDVVDSGDGALPHQVQRAPLRVLATNDGMRRMFPLPDDDTKYLEIGAPRIQVGGVWTQVSLGTPARSANTITWTRPQTITTLTMAGHYVKISIELLDGFVPENSRIAFPVSLGGGLTRSGLSIVNGAGAVVANLRPFVMYDAANERDIRPIASAFSNLNGQPYIVLTLPLLIGMSRPVIDPTLTLQPDATAGVDTSISSATPTAGYPTDTSLYIGESTGTVETDRGLIKFDLTTLPLSATISSATLSLYALTDRSTNARTFRVFRQKKAWIEAQATWNVYSTGNNWATAGGFDSADCEQTDIGNRNFSASETLNQFKDFSLTPTTKAGLDLGNGFLIKTDTESDDAYYFASSDNATAANRPKLVIDYALSVAGRSFFAAPFTAPFSGAFG